MYGKVLQVMYSSDLSCNHMERRHWRKHVVSTVRQPLFVHYLTKTSARLTFFPQCSPLRRSKPALQPVSANCGVHA